MVSAKFTVDIKGMPEVIWACRKAMASLLRAEADAEVSNALAFRLREIADRFEAGQ